MGNQKATRMKKKKGPGIDFKRVKTKVGKKLPRADNFTRTDFKAKALHLPDQIVSATKGATVTSRNLSLQELLAQAAHYNAHSRKDSLIGLQELLQHHPALLSLHTAAIIEKIAPRIADSDRTVRDALLLLLSKTVLPALPEALFASFFPVLAVHVCNGLTHMAAEVRLSSVAFLDLLITHYPALLRRSPTHAQIEDHYVTLLSITGPFGRTPASLLKVLSSLHLFLQAAQPSTPNTPGFVHQPEADRWRWGGVRAVTLHQTRSAVGIQSGERWLRGEDGTPKSGPPTLLLSQRLVPRLLDCWSECTPAALAVKPDATTTQCLVKIVRILHLLLEQHQSEEYLPHLTQKVVPHFPVSLPGVRITGREVEELVDLNLAMCQLMLPFLGGGENAAPWEGGLVEYLQSVLEGRVLPGSGRGLAKGLEKRSLTEAQTGVVLTSLEKVLPVVSEGERERLLGAFTGFYLGCSPQSRTKAAALRFMGQVLQDDVTFPLVTPYVAQRWLASLPRLLWELRSSSPPTSHQVLLLLLRSARAASPGGDLASAVFSLQPSLLPFFCLSLAPKTQGGGEVRKLGPFVSLPEGTQCLAVDLLPYLGELSPALVSALSHCCVAPGVGLPVVLRCLQVLHHCATATDSLPLASYLSFLVTLLAKWPSLSQPNGAGSGVNQSEPREDGTPREGRDGDLGVTTSSGEQEKAGGKDSDVLLDAVCAGLAKAGGGAVMLGLVGPLLTRLLQTATGGQPEQQGAVNVAAAYAALRAISTCVETGHSEEKTDAALFPADLAALMPSALAGYWLELTSSQGSRNVAPGEARSSAWVTQRSRPCLLLLQRQPWLLVPMLGRVGQYLDAQNGAPTSSLEQQSQAASRGKAVLDFMTKLFGLEELQALLVDCRGAVEKLVESLQKIVKGADSEGHGVGHGGLLLHEDLARLEVRMAVLFGQRTP